MQHFRLTLNRGAPAKRVVKNGRTYLVAPVSMIVPGVLEGSKGKLYYPPSEVERNPGVWNGYPITNGHPTNWYGEPVAAKGEVVLKRFRIGHVANDRWNGRARVAEGWFDEHLTKNKAPDVHAALLAGDAMELSTGLFTDDDPTPGVAPDGRPYDYVARNYKPDHLAILPHQTGACSLRDGCGLNVTHNCRSKAMTRRTNNPDLVLDIPVPDWTECASPTLTGNCKKDAKPRQQSDDLILEVPATDWAEVAASQDR